MVDMNTNKAVYWIALTAVAFGFSSEYHRGSFAGLHSAVQYTEARFCKVATPAQHALLALGILPKHKQSGPAEEFLAEQADQIERVLDRHQAEQDRAMAIREAELQRAQARMARSEAVLAHIDLGRLQVLDAPHFKITNEANHRVITICSKNGRHMRVEAGPDKADLDIDMPDVEVGEF
jgi:hypothetical protein